MSYKNPQDVLIDLTKYPAAVEAKLPAAAPKLSVKLAEIAGKLPIKLPDFPMEIPSTPAPPAMGPAPVSEVLGRRYVTGVEVVPTTIVAPVAPVARSKRYAF